MEDVRSVTTLVTFMSSLVVVIFIYGYKTILSVFYLFRSFILYTIYHYSHSFLRRLYSHPSYVNYKCTSFTITVLLYFLHTLVKSVYLPFSVPGLRPYTHRTNSLSHLIRSTDLSSPSPPPIVSYSKPLSLF